MLRCSLRGGAQSRAQCPGGAKNVLRSRENRAKRAPAASTLKPNPTGVVSSGPTKGSEAPTGPTRLPPTQREPRQPKGKGLVLLLGSPQAASPPREAAPAWPQHREPPAGTPSPERPGTVLLLILKPQLEATPVQTSEPVPGQTPSPPRGRAYPAARGPSPSPRAICTHGPGRWAGGVRTIKFLTRAQEPQLTLGPRKEKEFGYLKKKKKNEKSTRKPPRTHLSRVLLASIVWSSA